MQLLMFRHGLAEDHGPDGDDDSRRLTPEGVEKTAEAARGLAAIAERPDIIFASPKVRAAQTAQIVGKVFDRTPKMMEALASHSHQPIIDALSGCGQESILIVGHEPTLSQAAASLCTRGGGHAFIELKKAGCLLLDVAVQSPGVFGSAQLIWLATPKMLRGLAGKAE